MATTTKKVAVVKKATTAVVKKAKKAELLFENKTFVITGTFQDYERTEIEELITSKGGLVKGSVSSKTDYLICGEKAGSKLAKAEELGITIISEEEFKNSLTDNSSKTKATADVGIKEMISSLIDNGLMTDYKYEINIKTRESEILDEKLERLKESLNLYSKPLTIKEISFDIARRIVDCTTIELKSISENVFPVLKKNGIDIKRLPKIDDIKKIDKDIINKINKFAVPEIIQIAKENLIILSEYDDDTEMEIYEGESHYSEFYFTITTLEEPFEIKIYYEQKNGEDTYYKYGNGIYDITGLYDDGCISFEDNDDIDVPRNLSEFLDKYGSWDTMPVLLEEAQMDEDGTSNGMKETWIYGKNDMEELPSILCRGDIEDSIYNYFKEAIDIAVEKLKNDYGDLIEKVNLP